MSESNASTATTAPRVGSRVGGAEDKRVASGRLTSLNPARLSERVADVSLADAETFAEACAVAKRAQEDWARVPAPVRGRAVQQIGRLIEANKQRLAELITREIGKPYLESLGEVQEAIDTCNFFLGEGRRLYGHTVPSEMPDKQLFTFRTPVGVAAIVTAGNFPVAVPSWYLVPALLCGNAVVWKPAEYAAATGEALYEVFAHGGLPDGVLNLVIADGPTTHAGLDLALNRSLLDKVGFTGSTAVGRTIGELCGRHLVAPTLELGGKNPLVVMSDADLDLAVEGALFSGFGTAGQRCTSLGTVIVHESVHDEFLSRFAAATERAPVGDPMRDVLYGPMINERFCERFLDFLDLVRDHHELSGSSATGRITRDKARARFIGDDPEAGLYCHPTIVDGVTAEDELYGLETFGPIVGVATFDSFDEAVGLANGHGYGLSAAIYTNDIRTAMRFRERVSAGLLSVNNSTSGAEAHLPFGGNAKSGNGSRLSGVWVLEQFTRWQAMNLDFSGALQKAQMDTGDVEADLSFRLETRAKVE